MMEKLDLTQRHIHREERLGASLQEKQDLGSGLRTTCPVRVSSQWRGEGETSWRFTREVIALMNVCKKKLRVIDVFL